MEFDGTATVTKEERGWRVTLTPQELASKPSGAPAHSVAFSEFSKRFQLPVRRGMRERDYLAVCQLHGWATRREPGADYYMMNQPGANAATEKVFPLEIRVWGEDGYVLFYRLTEPVYDGTR